MTYKIELQGVCSVCLNTVKISEGCRRDRVIVYPCEKCGDQSLTRIERKLEYVKLGGSKS